MWVLFVAGVHLTCPMRCRIVFLFPMMDDGFYNISAAEFFDVDRIRDGYIKLWRGGGRTTYGFPEALPSDSHLTVVY